MKFKAWLPILALTLVLVFLLSACGQATTTAPAVTTTAAATTAATVKPTTAAPTSNPTTVAATTTAPVATTGSAPKVKTGGILKVGVSSDSVMLGDPTLSASQNVDSILSRPAIERVCTVDTAGNVVPLLAQSFTMSYSEMSATITLNKGITFSDGTSLNADALLWNYQQCIDAKITSVALIKSVVKVDDYTMKIYLSSWDADAGYNITNVCIVSPAAWQKNGAAWGKLNPVGTGPFIIASHQTDTLIKYTKNPNYWQKGQPYLDEIDMVVIKDAVTRLNSFKAGEIDVDIDPTADQAKDLVSNTKYVVQLLHGAGSFRLGPDGGNPTSPWANLAVRQALGYAIDRQSLVDAVFAGFGIPATQWSAPGTWTYNPNITGYTYDPVKAAALLKTAGYDANNPLKTTLIGQNTDWGPLTLQALQNMLAKVNIKADINALALPALTTVWNTGWKNGIGIRQLPPAPFMTSWGANYVIYSNRSTWVSLYNDPALDELAHQANSAPDMQTRQPLVWKMMDTVFYQDAQQIPLLISDAIVLRYPYTNDDGIYSTPLTGEWHPNTAWLNK